MLHGMKIQFDPGIKCAQCMEGLMEREMVSISSCYAFFPAEFRDSINAIGYRRSD